MQPTVDYQADYVQDLERERYPIPLQNQDREYLGSLIIAKLEFDRARKVFLTPAITKDSAGLRLSIRFR